MNVIDLYSIKDVSRIFGLAESRLRYWLQSGFLWPSVRRGGRFYYTFHDLINVKAAKGLLDAGIPMQRVRKSLEALRAKLPSDVTPASRLRICSDGETLVVMDDDAVYHAVSGQIVMAFAVQSLTQQVTDAQGGEAPEVTPVPVLQMLRRGKEAGAVAGALDLGPTERTAQSPYQCFLDGCAAEDRGDATVAELYYRRAIDDEPSLAAAHTNLGNLAYRRGELDEARRAYERALELEPGQPEARFNLGNLLGELGQTDLAIAELKQVCSRSPEFADAHYNLGLLLARVGGVAQAKDHLGRYLALDGDSEWAGRAREVLAQVG